MLFAQNREPLPVFRPAIEEIRSKAKVPIVLPKKLPFKAQDIKLVRSDVQPDGGYWITLYYSEDGIASYAAGFGAAKPQPTRHKGSMKLVSGIRARFMPVSCGSSCAPANLWWEQNGVEYQIQLQLLSTMPLNEQQRTITEVANSMVLVRN